VQWQTVLDRDGDLSLSIELDQVGATNDEQVVANGHIGDAEVTLSW